MKTKKSKTLKKQVRNVMWGFYSRMHEFKKQYTFEQYINFCIAGNNFVINDFKIIAE